MLLQLQNIHMAYGANVILDDVTLAFNEGQKLGVIGRNGAGKTTLCKIITGHEEPDGGLINKSSDLRLAYLEQLDPYRLDETVMGFLERYTGKEPWLCGKVAGRFQLKNELLDTTIGALSGGYRTRVKLTSMLLKEPNFLILDEPTNYLDLKTLMLLEEFLMDYRGGFLVVSHDREFLKRTCSDTLEIENGGCTLYPGTVEEYLIFKEEQKDQAIKYNQNIENKQKKLQLFVDRFRAKASKASQARSKMKEIERLKTIEVGHALSNVHIKIPEVPKRNGFALRTTDLAIGYPELIVAQEINIDVFHGSHVAVLGDNGQGKTTFLRTIAQDLDLKNGSFRWGHALKIGYYAQHVLGMLELDCTVLQHLSSVADKTVSRQDILNLAGSFLFKGTDVEKKISVLSGGEKARLCLAGLLLQKNQVLLFDEPTNHLDFETVEALGRALKSFSGTIFFISHDRTFVNLIAAEIIEVSRGSVKKYPGNYEEYVYHIQTTIQDEFRTEREPVSMSQEKVKNVYQQNKELQSEKRKLLTKLHRIEKRMELHKEEFNAIDHIFMADSTTWTRERSERHETLAKLIREDEDLWIELNEKIEAIKLD